ncbi:MAG: hypothetical protein H0W02_07930 [Ktedonobacteraceae bacterium]|nr:hypothetical protein [Ktedonobacteraceae bacterium]
MRRIGIIGMILGVLLIADGIYMVMTHYNDGETQALNLPDGWIVIISASVLLLAAILAFVLPSRSRQTAPARVAVASTTEPASTMVTPDTEPAPARVISDTQPAPARVISDVEPGQG